MRHLARVSFVVPLLLALRAAPVAAFSDSRWLSALAGDLRNPDATGRLNALALRACTEGWPEFPGSQACYFGSGFE